MPCYCSAPDALTRFFVRPGLGFACVVGRPEHVQLVYRSVSYLTTGEADGFSLPPAETSVYAIRAQRIGQPDLVLREGSILGLGSKGLVRLCSLGEPYWRQLSVHHKLGSKLPDATDYLLSYLKLEKVEQAAVEEVNDHIIWLDYTKAYF